MDLPLGFLFEGLSDEHLKRIVAVTKEITMEEGEEIFKEGGSTR